MTTIFSARHKPVSQSSSNVFIEGNVKIEIFEVIFTVIYFRDLKDSQTRLCFILNESRKLFKDLFRLERDP